MPLFANVTHETSKKGKKFATVASVMPLPKTMDCPKQVNESLLYSPYTHDDNIFARLHQKTQETILKSDEMIARQNIPSVSSSEEIKGKVTIDQVPF